MRHAMLVVTLAATGLIVLAVAVLRAEVAASANNSASFLVSTAFILLQLGIGVATVAAAYHHHNPLLDEVDHLQKDKAKLESDLRAAKDTAIRNAADANQAKHNYEAEQAKGHFQARAAMRNSDAQIELGYHDTLLALREAPEGPLFAGDYFTPRKVRSKRIVRELTGPVELESLPAVSIEKLTAYITKTREAMAHSDACFRAEYAIDSVTPPTEPSMQAPGASDPGKRDAEQPTLFSLGPGIDSEEKAA